MGRGGRSVVAASGFYSFALTAGFFKLLYLLSNKRNLVFNLIFTLNPSVVFSSSNFGEEAGGTTDSCKFG